MQEVKRLQVLWRENLQKSLQYLQDRRLRKHDYRPTVQLHQLKKVSVNLKVGIETPYQLQSWTRKSQTQGLGQASEKETVRCSMDHRMPSQPKGCHLQSFRRMLWYFHEQAEENWTWVDSFRGKARWWAGGTQLREMITERKSRTEYLNLEKRPLGYIRNSSF